MGQDEIKPEGKPVGLDAFRSTPSLLQMQELGETTAALISACLSRKAFVPDVRQATEEMKAKFSAQLNNKGLADGLRSAHAVLQDITNLSAQERDFVGRINQLASTIDSGQGAFLNGAALVAFASSNLRQLARDTGVLSEARKEIV